LRKRKYLDRIIIKRSLSGRRAQRFQVPRNLIEPSYNLVGPFILHLSIRKIDKNRSHDMTFSLKQYAQHEKADLKKARREARRAARATTKGYNREEYDGSSSKVSSSNA
jgi:hypothetical protein